MARSWKSELLRAVSCVTRSSSRGRIPTTKVRTRTVRLARTANAMAHLAVVLLLIAAARQAPLAAGGHSANPHLRTCAAAAAAAPDVAALQEHGGGGGRRILDITHAVRPELPVLGSGAGVGALVRLKRSIANGSRSNLSVLRMSVHTGTHVDAPGHMWQQHFEAGLDVDTLDLELLNGPALLVDVPRHSNITAEVMESLNIPRGVYRVLFRTMNTDKRLMWQKESDLSFVGFTEDGAQWLVGYTDIKLVGVDYLSVASYEYMIPAHVVFLKSREIVIVEALKLDDVEPGMYMLHCLPLRLVGAEGSPVSETESSSPRIIRNLNGQWHQHKHLQRKGVPTVQILLQNTRGETTNWSFNHHSSTRAHNFTRR